MREGSSYILHEDKTTGDFEANQAGAGISGSAPIDAWLAVKRVVSVTVTAVGQKMTAWV